MGQIDDIMCDDITHKYLHFASVAGKDNVICDDLAYDDLNPVCMRIWDRLPI